ncbi:asparagine synthase (glutamine-hydrolyzing) [candidate division WOR-3 bacterium]|nr:asparagine synthase (glutamine-hydrolyzing) [candidate division WOR-3 bacterium]
MCGIAGLFDVKGCKIENLSKKLDVMNFLQSHRGPDDQSTWRHKEEFIGFAHKRLSVIDIANGCQPMKDDNGNCIVFNGEIYNFKDIRKELGEENFNTNSDTEVILKSYAKWGTRCLEKFRGMFAFTLWDEKNRILFCARDRFGIKPFYYTEYKNIFLFASEAKALLPFVDRIETDLDGFKDYLTFQFCLDGKSLFKGIKELLPAHYILIKEKDIQCFRYWQVFYDIDFNHTAKYFSEETENLFAESIKYHKVSDVPIGGYLSGGLDSSIVNLNASAGIENQFAAFNGRFTEYEGFDESDYAQKLADFCGFNLLFLDIKSSDFIENIKNVVYHLDYPVAGPGSFPQFMLSSFVKKHRKVMLGGQGADEIFGGYARYMIAYFEQCIKGAIEGTLNNGNFVVTYESIIPNLKTLQKYKPLLKEFWAEGLFDDMDKRYFRLISRNNTLNEEIIWEELGSYSPYETFLNIFRAENVGKESYFDRMTHFDFKTLLPALLHVEDRMSMAFGVESRVPFLDHKLVEFSATVPSDIKFKNGELKHLLKIALGQNLPDIIKNRKDKMGFPVPLVKWMNKELKEFLHDVFSSKTASTRPFINNRKVLKSISQESEFGRKVWGLLCLELWQEQFHDREHYFKSLIKEV